MYIGIQTIPNVLVQCVYNVVFMSFYCYTFSVRIMKESVLLR